MPTCASCGGTTSSVWYGRAGEDRFCKKRACQRYGGYDAPLRAGGPPASRQRRTMNSTGASSSDEDAFTALTTSAEVVAEVYSCLGQRCVLPACLPAFALLCSASPSTAPYCAELHRFCNVAALSAVQRRNYLPEEDHSLEYLIYGKFHHNADDLSGYITTAWTPMTMLEEAANAPELLKSVRSFVEASFKSFLVKFGSDPPVSAAVDAAVSSIRRPGKQGAAEKTAMLDDSATSASLQTSEAEEEGEGEGGGENSLPEASATCETDTAAH